MATLYAGKVSGVLVSLLFVPLYSRELGAAEFGVVAIILSLQMLLLMLDFGLATLVSREVASAPADNAMARSVTLAAERALLAMYACALVVGVVVAVGEWKPEVSRTTLFGSIALFGLMVVQNLHYAALLARRAYVAASMTQFVWNLARAGATAWALLVVEPTVECFVATQALMALGHASATRWQSLRLMRVDVSSVPAGSRWQQSLELVRRGKSLALFSLAGAAVLQLDKPIILVFLSAASVAPYFLAMTLCMVPLSILAGPVAQYFQPQLIGALAVGRTEEAGRAMRRFSLTIAVVTLVPSAVLWLARDWIVAAWLGHSEHVATVAHYVAILLPGLTVGALGFLPYTLQLARKDDRFQAVASSAMTIVTLALTMLAARWQSVEGVCVVYAAYHSCSTAVSWIRAFRAAATRELARVGLRIVGVIGAAVLVVCLLLSRTLGV